jgi:hypothetical protein
MKTFLFFVLLLQAQAFNTVDFLDLLTKDARLRKYNRQ